MALDPKRSSFLIVDDARTVRKRTRAMLHAAGIPDAQITDTGDAFDALDRFRENQPDVVLLDIMLPGIPGAEVGSIMMSEHPDAHVALMTGLEPSHEEVRHLLSQGAIDVIEKPVRTQDVDRLIELLETEHRALPGEDPAHA